MKKYLKSILYIVSILLALTFFITLLNYVGIINGIILDISKIVIPIISLFVGGIIIGKNSIQKGWLNGLKIGLIVILLMVIFSLLSNSPINLKTYIYYTILLFISIFGSMIGIMKKST